MAAGTYNWDITAGDGETRVFNFTDEDGNPIDKTTSTFDVEFRLNRGVDDGGTVVVAECVVGTSSVTVSLTGTQTREMYDESRRWYWDLQETPLSAEPVTLLKGAAAVSPDVTR